MTNKPYCEENDIFRSVDWTVSRFDKYMFQIQNVVVELD